MAEKVNLTPDSVSFERVKQEFKDLYEKVQKLDSYCGSSDFESLVDSHKTLLRMQYSAMTLYLQVLDFRLCNWDKTTNNHKPLIEKPAGLIVPN